MPWTVKDYWDWNPAFTAGLANFQREQDRATEVAEAEKNRGLRREELDFRVEDSREDRELRREDLRLRRGTENRIANIQERQQTRLEASDLDDMTQKMAAALAFQGAPEDPDFLKNPAARAGWEIGKAKSLEVQQRQQDMLDRIAEREQFRVMLEEMRAENRVNQPSRFNTETETVRDEFGDVIGTRTVPLGTLGSNMVNRASAPASPPVVRRYDKSGKLIK